MVSLGAGLNGRTHFPHLPSNLVGEEGLPDSINGTFFAISNLNRLVKLNYFLNVNVRGRHHIAALRVVLIKVRWLVCYVRVRSQFGCGVRVQAW